MVVALELVEFVSGLLSVVGVGVWVPLVAVLLVGVGPAGGFIVPGSVGIFGVSVGAASEKMNE